MFVQDLRRAFRIFRLEPKFALAAVMTLALGIGANTALFAVVEAVLLRPLPLADADQLVILKHRNTATGITKEFLGLGDFFDIRDRQRTMQAVAPYGLWQGTLFEGDEPTRITGVIGSPELFDVLRLQPDMGRALTADDARSGAPPVALISREMWETEFGSDPNIIGRGVQIGASRRAVVGVLPRGFQFPPGRATQAVLSYPYTVTAPAARQDEFIQAAGRIARGQSLAAVVGELHTLSSEFAREYPSQNSGTEYYAEPLRDALVGNNKRPLLLLMGAVGFVLLIACVNVGNLLLARALGRRQELSVRLALGAPRSRLALQILTESLVLALVGGAAGVAIAWQAAPALAALVPESTQVPALKDVGMNLEVVLFSFAVSLASSLMFGAVSCLSLTNTSNRAVLAAARGASMGAATRRLASVLVAGEIALASILLLGAGLTLRSFANLLAVDPGFRIDNVLTVQVSAPTTRYQTIEAQNEFFNRAFRVLEDLPEVEHAGGAAVTPLTGNNWTSPFQRADRPAPAAERPPDVGFQTATAGYFSALGIPLKSGRLFADGDRLAKVIPVVIISEEVERLHFPGENPVGHRLKSGDTDLEIVGVVGNIRRAALTDQPRADMYFPHGGPGVTMFIQTAGDPLSALPAIRTALRTLEPAIVIHGARTMTDVASSSMAITSLAMRLLAGFAIVALVLAAIGIYGVMAYSVRRRTRELGTRVALGADRADIIRLVMREGGAITVAGVVVGIGAGVLAARSLSAVLYGVPAADPVSLIGAAAVLVITGLAACSLPALRASRVDPAKTLTE